MQDAMSAGTAPRSVDAGRGLGWWTDAWAMFTRNAGMWIVFGIVLLVIFVVLGVIPFLGGLAASLLAPVFVGGWMLAARKSDQGGAPELGDLFGGFKEQLSSLLVLGALLLVAMLVIFMVVGALGFGAFMGVMSGGGHAGTGMAAAMGGGMLAMLLSMVLGVLVAMAIWFAPALVVLRGVAPVEAMKLSFAACLKNIVAFLLYGVIYLIAAVIASIPFGLGWIVLVPLLMLTVYVSFKDLF